MRIKLTDAVTKQATIEVCVRPELHAFKCDGCGSVFKMDQFSSNDQSLGEFHGTFETGDVRVVDADGKGCGNIFIAHVCSFRCAHDVFTGGWRTVSGYESFVEAERRGFPIKLARAEIRITAMVSNEAQLRERWEAIDRTEASKRRALESLPSSSEMLR